MMLPCLILAGVILFGGNIAMPFYGKIIFGALMAVPIISMLRKKKDPHAADENVAGGELRGEALGEHGDKPEPGNFSDAEKKNHGGSCCH